ncbi:TPA: recombinase family protein [Clostridioides difficile]|uniref:Site-specific recombinase n=1 Tax=Clostridioides difficile ATCC 9689 = DSM 1296 TaxID=1121308 RepID=A0AC59FZR2_CLODI|nr:recombinase family protein [Clostridioides difficile]OFU24271.1 serine recombinase [Clostridium sp. HMSC19B12]OFU35033.1 serine recombinase [Clostridium sp. HMSC19B04]CCL64838.1 Site-specific recombinase, resolvase family [Clostridioides difficile E7]AKP42846.1 site-specific recombinase [Clostridioides difficile ATCC 9689 = DSM 1296]AQU09749.1 serine recombinase [Clostridioides difficile]
MKAAIYSRKSRFTGKGDSIENQIQLCIDYAKSIGVKDFLIYEDEGFSGSNIDRPQFKKMMQDAKDKKFSYLVCYRLDRISRNVSDFSTLIEKLNELNISFISIKEQFDTSTPMGRAMMFISSVFAQLERETIAERIKDNMYELARSGRWLGGNTPHGFNSEKITFLDENLKERSMYKLQVNDEQMEIVKLIYNKYLELRSLSKLYKYVYNNGIRGPRGGKFDPSSLSRILRNPAYVKANDEILDYLKNSGMDVVGTPDRKCGILTYAKNTSNSIAAIAKHHGVIEPEIWLEVQNQLDKNRDKTPRISTGKTALLSGLIKCGKCGSNMRITYKGKKTDKDLKYYYICGTKKTLGSDSCNCKNLNGPLVESLVIDKIKNCKEESIISAFNSNNIKTDNVFNIFKSETNLLKNQILDKERLIKNLVIELAKNTGSTASDYIVSQIESLNNEISILKDKINILESSNINISSDSINIDIIVSNLKRFNDEVDNASLDDKRLLLSTIINSIVWDSSLGNLNIVYMGAEVDNSVSLSN